MLRLERNSKAGARWWRHQRRAEALNELTISMETALKTALIYDELKRGFDMLSEPLIATAMFATYPTFSTPPVGGRT